MLASDLLASGVVFSNIEAAVIMQITSNNATNSLKRMVSEGVIKEARREERLMYQKLPEVNPLKIKWRRHTNAQIGVEYRPER
jgi:hypothetical protein